MLFTTVDVEMEIGIRYGSKPTLTYKIFSNYMDSAFSDYLLIVYSRELLETIGVVVTFELIYFLD